MFIGSEQEADERTMNASASPRGVVSIAMLDQQKHNTTLRE